MIVADSLTKYYGAHKAVSDLSFNIHEGEVVGLLGLNGAGKTTTLRLLSGLLMATSGRVVVGGFDMAIDPEKARGRIGFLPETPPLYPEMTVIDYLRFVARIKNMRGNINSALTTALESASLQEVQHDPIGTLSHGFQRRVGIAQAIINRPALILMDEPTSGLDPVQVVHMRSLIRGLRGKHTLLISSHILGEIHQLCDRILVLQHGHIAAEGTEEELAGRITSVMALRLEIRGDMQQLSKELDSNTLVHQYAYERSIGDVHHLTVQLNGDHREELASTFIAMGFGLRRMETVRLELENIFLQLAAGDKR